MSSILSDFFYNPSKKAIIDQYLLQQNTKQQQHSQSHINNQSNIQPREYILNEQSEQTGGKRIANMGRQKDQPTSQEISDISKYSYYNEVLSKYVIKLAIQIAPFPSNFDKSTHNAVSELFKSNIYHLIRVGIGSNTIEQTIKPVKNRLYSSLQIQALGQQIQKYQVLSIEVFCNSRLKNKNRTHIQISSKHRHKQACCYIPMQNIRRMINKNQFNKKFELPMKIIQHEPLDRVAPKCKFLCELTIQNKSRSMGKYDQREKFYDRKDDMQVPPQNTARDSSLSNLNFVGFAQRQGRNRHNVNQQAVEHKNKSLTREKWKIQYKFRESQNNLNSSKRDRHYNSESNSQALQISHHHDQQSDNKLQNFKLDNKPIVFKVIQYKSNHHLQPKNIDLQGMATHKQEVMQIFTFNYFLQNQGNHEPITVHIGDSITIPPSNIDKKGITVSVQSSLKGLIGFFKLNVVLLLSRCIEGIFPVVKEDTQQCIGVVKLSSTTSQSKSRLANSINKQIQAGQLPTNTNQQANKQLSLSQLSNQCHESAQGCKIFGVALTFQKLLLLPSFTQLSVSSTSQLIAQLQASCQNNPQILLRLSDSTIKVYKNCKILQNKQMLQISVKQPIIIYSQHSAGKNKVLGWIQIEVYVQDQLVAYSKLPLSQAQKQKQPVIFDSINNVIFGSAIQNLSTSSWICHSILNFAVFVIDADYFPLSHLPLSLKYLVDMRLSKLFQVLAFKNSISSQSIGQFVHVLIDQLVSLGENIIYIQAYRIATLLINAFLSGNYTFLKTSARPSQSLNIGKNNTLGAQNFLQQIKYLDEQAKGSAQLQDIQCIRLYYGISSKQIESSRSQILRGSKYKLLKNEVLYLLLIADVQIQAFSFQNKILDGKQCEFKRNQKGQDSKIEYQVALNKLNRPMRASETQQKNIQQNSKTQQIQFFHLETVQCENMHYLFSDPQSVIPSIRISIPSQQYSSRTCYSCLNPIIRVGRKIKHGEVILFLHNDIKMKSCTEVGRLVYESGRDKYELRNGCFVKVRIIL